MGSPLRSSKMQRVADFSLNSAGAHAWESESARPRAPRSPHAPEEAAEHPPAPTPDGPAALPAIDMLLTAVGCHLFPYFSLFSPFCLLDVPMLLSRRCPLTSVGSYTARVHPQFLDPQEFLPESSREGQQVDHRPRGFPQPSDGHPPRPAPGPH